MRAREEVGAAPPERVVEQGPWGEHDIQVALTGTERLLFSETPEMVAETGERVIRQIKTVTESAAVPTA